MRKTTVLLSFVVFCVASVPAFAQCPPFPQAPVDIRNPAQVAQTMWQIFVAAACPTARPKQYPYVQWETWIEQLNQYPAANTATSFAAAKRAPEKRFHVSPLALVVAARSQKTLGRPPAGANQNCGPGHGDSSVILCEEVRINPVASSYIGAPAPGATLAFRAGQAKFATMPTPPYLPPGWPNINFPWPAIEVKVDWVQLPAPCPSSVQGSVWTETYGSNCYALAGMHVISKLLPNWIWATFEPQNQATNPNRCVVLGCNDPFGSNPAQTPANAPGTTTQITPALQSMMTAANLDPLWQNYRLDGVQVTFTDDSGNATRLGNSVIEGENAGVPLKESSCITCHHVSSINAAGADGINNLTSNPIGDPAHYPSGFAGRDFVWSLMLACPGGVGGNCSPSGLTAASPKSGTTKKK